VCEGSAAAALRQCTSAFGQVMTNSLVPPSVGLLSLGLQLGVEAVLCVHWGGVRDQPCAGGTQEHLPRLLPGRGRCSWGSAPGKFFCNTVLYSAVLYRQCCAVHAVHTVLYNSSRASSSTSSGGEVRLLGRCTRQILGVATAQCCTVCRLEYCAEHCSPWPGEKKKKKLPHRLHSCLQDVSGLIRLCFSWCTTGCALLLTLVLGSVCRWCRASTWQGWTESFCV